MIYFLPNLLLFLWVLKYYFIPIKKMGYDFTNVPGQESSKFLSNERDTTNFTTKYLQTDMA